LAELAFEIIDWRGYTVQLEQDRWERHICEKHGEVQPFLDQIIDVIQNPSIVTLDVGDAWHLSRLGAIPTLSHLYLEIVIKYEQKLENFIGDVKTIHVNRMPPRGELKWLMK